MTYPITKDRVCETSVTTGTGTFNLAGIAASNYQSFVTAYGTGNPAYYAIFHQTAGEWEVGIGMVTDAAPDTISRDVVLDGSSGAGVKVNFSAGTKTVIGTRPGALPVRGASFGQLQVDSTTQISLQRYHGDHIEVNGEKLAIGASGITLITTAKLINSSGANTGMAMSPDTQYFLYVSNSRASYAPSSLRASTFNPSDSDGVKYLGVGNAAHWRFVGWVQTDGSTHFLDDTTNRNLCNEHNAIWKNIFLTPGYVDDNAYTSYAFASTVWAPINGGTGDGCSFISNGRDSVRLCMNALVSPMSGSGQPGIGIDSTTTAIVSQYNGGGTDSFCVPYSSVLPEGYHTANMLFLNGAAGNATIYADATRNGGASDPAFTYLEGEVCV